MPIELPSPALCCLRAARLVVIAASVGACATTAGYERLLASWVGQPELALLRAWGVPTHSFQSGNVRFLAFTSDRKVQVPGTAPTYTSTQVGNKVKTRQSGGSEAYDIQLRCVTTFEIVGERVTGFRWEGNDCKATDR